MKDSWKTESVINRYLSGTRLALPSLESQLDLMVKLIQAGPKAPQKILDLGCGDGFLGSIFKTIYPSAHVIFNDYSENMLSIARTKLAGIDGCTFVAGDFSSAQSWDTLAEYGNFDLVVSGFAIHHLPDDGKQAIYSRIFQCLAPSGLFLNLEHVASRTQEHEDLFEEIIIQKLITAEIDQSIPRTPDTIRKDFKEREDKQENKLASAELQCDWLCTIGYENVDIFSKFLEIALIGGYKP